MPYRKPKGKEPAAAPAAQESGMVDGIGRVLSGAVDTVAGVGQDIADGIPGYSALVAEVGGMLPGQTEQSVAASQQEARKRGVVPHVVGQAVGGAMTGAALAAALPAAAPIGGAIGSMAVAGAEAGLLAPFYKLGEVSNQAQLKSSPLRLEQIAHTLFSTETAVDMVKAMGMAWAFGGAGMGLQAAEHGLKDLAAKGAIQQVKGAYAKAARRMKMPIGGEEQLAQRALDEGMLQNSGRVAELKKQAYAAVDEGAKKLPVDMSYQASIAGDLDALVGANSHNAAMTPAIKYVTRQSAVLEKRGVTGPQLQEIVQGLKGKATASFKAGDGASKQQGQFYQDAAETIQDSMVERLKIFDPEAGAAYEMGNQDYRTYVNMESATEKLIAKQFTPKDAAQAAGGVAAMYGAQKLMGPQAAGIVDGALGLAGIAKFRGKNYATLLDKYAKAPPFATYLKDTANVVKTLLGPANMSQLSSVGESATERYDHIQKILRTGQQDPERVAAGIRQNLDFLPPHEADALTASTVNKLQAAALELPTTKGPATLGGIETSPSDREKRAFVEKFDCKFNPYKAVASGRADLVAEAEKYCPETIHALRTQLLEKFAEAEASGKPVSYSTKRRLSAILGIAGVPMQDPALGAKLQQIITTKREADTQAGQMGSARQAAAAMKNNKATLSRAQGILNSEGQ